MQEVMATATSKGALFPANLPLELLRPARQYPWPHSPPELSPEDMRKKKVPMPGGSVGYRKEPEGPFECPVCKESQDDLQLLISHIQAHKVKEETESEEPFDCCLCRKSFGNLTALDRHMHSHSGELPYPCGQCSCGFTSKGNLSRHVKSAHGTTEEERKRSPISDEPVPAKKPCLYSHPSTNSGAADDEDESYKDLDCGSSYASDTSCHPDERSSCDDTLKNHRCLKDRSHESNSLLQENPFKSHDPSSPSSAYQRFQCDTCKRAFPSSSALKLHSSTHENKKEDEEDEEEDDDDDDEFFNILDLRSRSSSSKSRDEIPSKLKDLYKPLYVSPGSPEPSLESVNTPPKTPVETSAEESEDLSLEIREMKLKGEFPCRLCSMVFPNLRALKGHNRMHLNLAPYRCNMCTYTSTDKSTLIRHMRTHNGERPFECRLCQYAFTTKANCERHLRNRHGKKSRDEIRNAITTHQMDTELPSNCESPYGEVICSICGADLKYSKALRAHLKAMHSDAIILPYRCKLCNANFSTRHKVSLHARKVHAQASTDRETTLVEENEDELARMERMKCSGEPVVDCDSDDSTDLSRLSGSETDLSTVEALINLSQSGIKDDTAECELSNNPLDLSKKSPSEGKEEEIPCDLSRKEPEGQDQHPAEHSSEFGSGSDADVSAPNTPSAFDPPTAPHFPASGFFPTKLETAYPNMNALFATPTMPFYFGAPFPTAGRSPFPFFVPATNPYENPTAFMEELKSYYEKVQQSFVTPTSSSGTTWNDYALAWMSGNHGAEGRGEKQEVPVAVVVEQAKKKNSHSGDRKGEVVTPQGAPPDSTMKLVIKNGVLMKKQKQRRYRTERPYACEHCAARFTLRSNMERHIKQQHPQFWCQKPRGGRRYPGLSAPVIQPSLLQNQPSVGKTETPPQNSNKSISSSNSNSHNHSSKNNKGDTNPQSETPKPISDKVRKAITEQLKSKRPPPDLEVKKEAEESETEELIIDETRSRSMSSNSEHGETSPRHRKRKESTKEDETETGVDLASVSKLLDQANTHSFQQFFKQQDEEEDGHCSGSDNSASDDSPSSKESTTEKRKSAYSSAPHKVSCPFCLRKFPWTSSLRRHILTHTGQKPYKCSQCPLWFTTKSNCDRHLLRKHGNSGESPYTMRNVPERPYKCHLCPSSTFSTPSNLKKHQALKHLNLGGAHDGSIVSNNNNDATMKSLNVTADFRCHMCDEKLPDRHSGLQHLQELHHDEYQALADGEETESIEDGDFLEDEGNGDEAEGKLGLTCVLCLKRLPCMEDLACHMKLHAGEKPFTCALCDVQFTLKTTFQLHMEKHKQEDVDLKISTPKPSVDLKKRENLMEKINRLNPDVGGCGTSDLIGNLLGIQDPKLIDTMLSKKSPDDVAKLLGVQGQS
ncbi:unnamed protein product [Darwinula stevensoni]|uniref:C2H2-type domain-containing protein n=1 Tax=Darwinula stevensoni TaxID=69355 RepID=A0A7R8XB81_9CRUS|nr:unnamed protein product [Darwinula stevensoni]CAG0884568.1 unnamed protein product [Darwinula stevensoni]